MSGTDPWDFSGYSRDGAGAGLPATESAGSAGGANQPGASGLEETPDSSGSDLTIGRPPVALLVVCGVLVLGAGAAGAVVGSVPAVAIAGWALAGPIAIGVLAVYSALDTRARAHDVYSRSNVAKPAYATCLVLCAVAVMICALRIAWWVGHL